MRINSVRALLGFRLELRFDDGATGTVDLSDFAGRGVFETCKAPNVFEQLKVTAEGAVEWPGEIAVPSMMSGTAVVPLSGKAAFGPNTPK